MSRGWKCQPARCQVRRWRNANTRPRRWAWLVYIALPPLGKPHLVLRPTKHRSIFSPEPSESFWVIRLLDSLKDFSQEIRVFDLADLRK